MFRPALVAAVVLALVTTSQAVNPLAAGLSFLVSALVPALVYPALLSVPAGKGVWMGIIQALLRVFLYVLIASLVMVGLAVWQIATGPQERRTEAPPVPAHVAERA